MSKQENDVQGDVKGFPDLTNKLAAPAKKSLFERQRAEAEAKRIREEAETAAVYQDFVKSFEDEELPDPHSGPLDGRPRGGFQAGSRALPGPGKRHFAPTSTRTSGPGSLGPPPSFGSKRGALEGLRPRGRERDGKEKEKGLFAFDDTPPAGAVNVASAFGAVDDEDERMSDSKAAERAAPKPTIQLSSLPPGTSPAVIKSILSSNLTVDGIRILQASGYDGSSTDRKSVSAIVTLAKDTPASEIDAAVNSLQNRYLGWGYYLSLSRYLSSAALGSVTSNASLPAAPSSLPFGARGTPQGGSGNYGGSFSRAPPPGMHRGGFAPPSSYDSTSGRNMSSSTQVTVTPPSDIKQIKLIHKTLESLLTHGPEFEALLMSRPEVQRGERWAWLWNARSTGGVWYRWRLWEILTNSTKNRSRRDTYASAPTSHRLFDDSRAASWQEPEDPLRFEFTSSFDAFISDSDYDSSDEDADSGDEASAPRKRRRFLDAHAAGSGPPPEGILQSADAASEQNYLNPLQLAKLTHLLARLPQSTGRLRKGDVARVTAFAITHAGAGSEEVVDMLVRNVHTPVNSSRFANPGQEANDDNDGLQNPDVDANQAKKDDPTASALIALHLISDILSASSTSGVRHAWRYRSLFESLLTAHKTFTRLGRLATEQKWGRLRAEKWRRSIQGVLGLWEGWCVFPGEVWERFKNEFEAGFREDEERREREKMEVEAERAAKEASGKAGAGKSRWKSVAVDELAAAQGEGRKDVDNVVVREEVEEDFDGEPMEDDVDGEPMGDDDDDDVDGEPMQTTPEATPAVEETAIPKMAPATETKKEQEPAKPQVMQRPKAEDMFADSDEDMA